MTLAGGEPGDEVRLRQSCIHVHMYMYTCTCTCMYSTIPCLSCTVPDISSNQPLVVPNVHEHIRVEGISLCCLWTHTRHTPESNTVTIVSTFSGMHMYRYRAIQYYVALDDCFIEQ